MKTSGPVLFKSKNFTNRLFVEVLPTGSWKGKPCYIVGGGPSLKGFNWSLLRGKRTIGINLAFTKIEPTIIFSMDTRFLNWVLNAKYGKEAKEKFLKAKSFKVWLATYNLSLPGEIFIIPVFKSYRHGLVSFTFDLADGIGHGNNSGYAALNLAVCLGANPVYLLGFDCSHEKGRSHWHNGHPIKQNETTTKNFISYFEKQATRIKAKGFDVINLNPNSALECFEKKSIKEALH